MRNTKPPLTELDQLFDSDDRVQISGHEAPEIGRVGGAGLNSTLLDSTRHNFFVKLNN